MVGDQLAQAGVAVLAHGAVEARHRAGQLADLRDPLHGQAALLGDLLVGRLAAKA